MGDRFNSRNLKSLTRAQNLISSASRFTFAANNYIVSRTNNFIYETVKLIIYRLYIGLCWSELDFRQSGHVEFDPLTRQSKTSGKYQTTRLTYQRHCTTLQTTHLQRAHHGAIHIHTLARPIGAVDGQKPILPCTLPPTSTRSRPRPGDPGTMDLPRRLHPDRRRERGFIGSRRASVNVDATRQLSPSG